MADEIIARCSTLSITEEEEIVIGVNEIIESDERNDLDLSIVGKIMTTRPCNFEAFKKTMNQIWSISKAALFRQIESGLFVVQFASVRDRAKVLAGRPWTFDNHLILMKELEGSFQPSEIILSHSPFWIRLYNLPLDCRTEKHIRLIGGSVGEILEVEHSGVLWDKSARLKVLLDVSTPLRRILKVRNSKGVVVVVEVKYERLPTFCYVCGQIGHIERDCTLESEDERGVEKQWGAWLKASPRRGRLMMEEEVKNFLKCYKSLAFENQVKQATEHSEQVIPCSKGQENPSCHVEEFDAVDHVDHVGINVTNLMPTPISTVPISLDSITDIHTVSQLPPTIFSIGNGVL
ncbi:uncharacterized protein LOC125494667 [Beta vulgaris subsp. vulgaris]|uniref:uncharacterized protein LOC125494667 n=1 Tax=Beta vulgaris subsp. vulgaris TaxID=3555 RepID=UPI00203741E4|nr:uncharacterized protein LOC125494667 [Beta vulgaris subsp. vulgaris]